MGSSSSKGKPKKPVGNSGERRVSPEILAPAASASSTQEPAAALPVASALPAVTAANKTASPTTATPAAEAAPPTPAPTETVLASAPDAKAAPPTPAPTETVLASAPDAKAAPPTPAPNETVLASARDAVSEVSTLNEHAGAQKDMISVPCAAEPALPAVAVLCDTLEATPAEDAPKSQAAAPSPATVEAVGPTDVPADGTAENSGKAEVLGAQDRKGGPLESTSSVGAVAEPPADAALSEKTSQILAAAEGEDWEGVADILREAAVGECDPNVRTQDWGYSLLRAAAEEGAEEVCRLLVKHRADVNLQDKGGMTPLMGCAVGGDVPELVTLLLEARADAAVSTEDDQFTALRWATRLDRHETVRILRAAGMTGAATAF